MIDVPEWTVGSEKQQKWAADIRANVIAWFDTAISVYSGPRPADQPLAGDADQVAAKLALDKAIAAALPIARDKFLAANREPGWWIDLREGSVINHILMEVSRKTGASFSGIGARVRRERPQS